MKTEALWYQRSARCCVSVKPAAVVTGVEVDAGADSRRGITGCEAGRQTTADAVFRSTLDVEHESNFVRKIGACGGKE